MFHSCAFLHNDSLRLILAVVLEQSIGKVPAREEVEREDQANTKRVQVLKSSVLSEQVFQQSANEWEWESHTFCIKSDYSRNSGMC